MKSNTNIIESTNLFLGLTPAEVDRLLAVGSGDAALLYLYARKSGKPYPDAMPGFSPERLRAARNILQEAGLFAPPPDAPGPQGPLYDDKVIAARSLTDVNFKHILDGTEELLEKKLSPQELQMLYGIYDWRGFSPSVLWMLICFCVAEQKRIGGTLSVWQLDKEAGLWVRDGIQTDEDAEVYIRRKESRRESAGQAYAALGIHRAPTKSEKEFVEAWLKLGFNHEAIAKAYDITMLRLGKLQWKYVDKILRNWHERDLHDVADIETAEKNYRPRNRRNVNHQVLG